MVAYRDKPELYSVRPSPEERRQRQYIFWLIPLWLTPGLVRIAKTFGFEASHEVLLAGTVVMAIVCVAGAIISYRAARVQVERDLADLTPPQS
jgi:hypothetical protein